RVGMLEGPSFDEGWSVDHPGEESAMSAAFVRLGENRAGLLVSHNVGAYPDFESTVHRLLDGSDGSELGRWSSSLPYASSPLAVDMNGDGVDELIMGSTTVIDLVPRAELRIFDVAREELRVFELPFAMGATPLAHVAEGHDRLELALVGFRRNEAPTEP